MYQDKLRDQLSKLWTNDYVLLTKFIAPLIFTNLVVDIGEQFLNRSVARSSDAVNVLASFGLAYVFVKFFVGVLDEMKQVGLVLVQDKVAYRKVLLYSSFQGICVAIFLILLATTQIGVWAIKDLHETSTTVTELTRSAFFYLSAYPLIDLIAWYHGGILLQDHHGFIVGCASLADIIGQVVAIAVLLYTPLVCVNPIVVPILASYAGVVLRLVIILVAFFRTVFPKMGREVVVPITVWKVTTFASPLMFTMTIQRISRPLVNLLVARLAPSKCAATEALAVLTATYPLGHIVYGWLNELRPIVPAFGRAGIDKSNRVISGAKMGIFSFVLTAVSALICFGTFWTPTVSISILEYVVGVSYELALQSVIPLKMFAFLCFAVGIRAPLTGWLTLHKQTKLIAPSGAVRVATCLTLLFTLPYLGLSGASMGVLALVFSFFTESTTVVVAAAIYAFWMVYKARRFKLLRSNEIECSLIKDDIGKENEDDLSTLLTDHEQHLSGQYSIRLS
eukprot:Em0052g6a